ncbi:MAG TPA: LD-carboxypeptidase [Caulobacteraceae bacterium]|jgi:muramoyltetrapeptide carboxypeptidase|nr:LD-carboxypeptidase [Caulobacteraceae bacterium]
MRIGVVAPAGRVEPSLADRTQALAEAMFPGRAPEVWFHPQCFLSSGHFAGHDAARAAAFLEVANDPGFDALWCARGGYGSNRSAAAILEGVKPAARDKAYLGYSDIGFLLAGLYRAGFERLAHGPVPRDLDRPGGEAAAARALRWLVDGAEDTLEPSLAKDARPAAAFNLCVLSHLVGTPLEPDLSGHVLMVEDTSEHQYRVDRSLFHVTSQSSIRKLAGLRLGRINDTPPNDPDFAMSDEAIARHWCAVSGIDYLGRADIGHDIDNKIVPFGRR